MKRTTVYLSDQDLDQLRRMSIESGRSQAELIREGIQRVTAPQVPREFRSRGMGRGTGEPVAQEFEDYLRTALSSRHDADR